ncbi:Conidial yellow pigment biosynthesis polyketide synthase [Penicillium subrubescens]|uniref:Conidial yellow pigment biosynthesis polyketide synthase n=1 Tax=Penicillium subrubescens TaxID=1316194 RepID=A0A1Q5UEF8_9EURO|nr:Conidial yellow pigment biosynthesis polyketide synthase [Penicillium subrubescens]
MHRPSKADQLTLVVVGDQTSNVSALIKRLLLGAPHSVAQSSFVRDASAALRAQSDRLRPFQREHLPYFKDIHELARIYYDTNGVCHPSISSALLCVTQLLQVIRYFEDRGRQPENNKNIAVVGLCTGSLVAAAYAASASLDDIKTLAVPAVSMAFQMGLQAATASSMLHEQGNSPESWSIAIPKITEDEALSALKIYDSGSHLSLRHRCFVSAVGLKSVTISGSPPALNRFAESLTTSQPSRNVIRLPIFAAYHASHVHTVLDFSSFLSRCGIDASLLSSFKTVKTLISPLTGQPVESSNALGLFKTVVHHTLQAPLRLDLIVNRHLSLIREELIAHVDIEVVGPTSVGDSLASVFKTHTTASVRTHELSALDPLVNDHQPSAVFNNAPLAIVPRDRFDIETHVDPSGKAKNTSWTPFGCFIDRPGDFDPRFFNMSPREALQTDPMQRLALVTAYEALEMAGFVPDRTRSSTLDRVGTFYGQTSDDYRDVNAAQEIGTYFITGGIRAFAPGRINYFFKFEGPSYSVDTACSSSLAAIQLACTSLWSGNCNTAVAGGLSVLTSPDLFSGLSRGQFLSQTGSCKTFDNSADGYCRADGIGSVVIKRLTDAELDRDNILAVILGAGTNHSANAISITHPHAQAQSSLYREVLEQSGIDPLDVGYIEMHGTGTQAGDGTEMKSVVDVFAPTNPSRADDNPLYVGALKGGNTALLIQEHPSPIIQQDVKPRLLHPVTVSGHTKAALRNNLDRLIDYLSANPLVSPVDLSYTTTARRRHHAFRLTVTETGIERITSALENKRDSVSTISATPGISRPIVFVFTGQGAAYPKLAHELYSTSSQFRADIVHFDGIARQQGFLSFLPLIDGSISDISLLSPMQAQIGLVCIQIALARLWNSWGIKPAAVVGHSLGEYTALQVSGVLSISDTIFLVGYRGRLLESRCEMYSHAMLAVQDSSSTLDLVSSEIASGVEIACINSPRETVFSGDKAAIEKFEAYLVTKKIRATKLPVAYAFHSAQVDPILDDLEEVAKVVNMGKPHIPVISSLSGRVLGPTDHIDAQYIRQHCRRMVQFSSAVKDAKNTELIQDSTLFIEIGPHPICSGMIRSILGENVQTLPTLRKNQDPWEVIVKSLASLQDAGFAINWSEYHRDFERACRLLTLPAYAFDNKNYWIEYRNDWTLRKGDPLPITSGNTEAKQESKTLSTSVHRVMEERYDGAKGLVVFETDLSCQEIYTAISGHRLQSLYANMALTIGQYLQKHPDSGLRSAGQTIDAMEIQHPLIIKSSQDEESRILQIYARLDVALQTVGLEYATISANQKSKTIHATCRIQSGSAESWLRRWSHDFHLIQDRILALNKLANSGEINQITTGLAYRLFASLVNYSPQYQRMDQVLLSSSLFEATANVKLDVRGDDSSFDWNPYWIDGLLHISGFALNGNETLNPDEAVYISHGWDTLRFAKPLRPDTRYQTYVRMLPRDMTMFGGNVWILCDGEVVGLAEDVRFQRVPRAVLNMLLPPLVLKGARKKNSPLPAAQAPGVARPTTTGRDNPKAHLPPQREAFLHSIASELGLEASEISPHDKLADLGVDSLMTLTLAGNLLDQFGLEVSHNELMSLPTISELLDILEQRSPGDAMLSPPFTTQELAAPAISSQSSDSSLSFTTETFTPNSDNGDTAELVRSIIIEETGILFEDLEFSADLGSLGVDSLMGLTVLGRLREAGVELETNFFLENRTMGEVFKALSCPPVTEKTKSPVTDKVVYNGKSAANPLPIQSDARFRAKAILLQRRSDPSSTENLFLFPDGSGSPSSYAALEQINPKVNVYGLVCPFIDSPGDYTCGLEAIVKIYLAVIKETQPQGPYHFGGWSAGGVLAYEASRQLIEANERVRSLLLIDAPCPTVLPPMPSSLIEFLESKGLFSQFQDKPAQRSKERRHSVLKHFESTVQNLSLYNPIPIIPAAEAPETVVLWAQEGVSNGSRPVLHDAASSDATVSWILDDRNDFSPRGWEMLIPDQRISTLPVPGNHFTMMSGHKIVAISRHLQEHFSRYQMGR